MADIGYPVASGLTVRAYPTVDGRFDYYAVNPDGSLGERYDAPPPGARVELALTIPATGGATSAESPARPFLFNLGQRLKLPDLPWWFWLIPFGLIALWIGGAVAGNAARRAVARRVRR